jgi:valyl-tRNA synthetase
MTQAELPSAYEPNEAAARWSAAWSEADVYRADPSQPGEAYTIVIPPPNVTGSLHMGHALNNTLQDVLIRYKRMDGFNVLWVPGTDHAGIATQWVVRRQLEAKGIDFRSLGREEFVRRIWEWKAEAGGRITNQLRRLGVSCDWSRERFTLDDDLAKAVTEHFVRLYEDGLIYRGQRLINWDPVDQTALSDLEVEHEENVQGELFEFAYRLSDGSGEIVVATTRPETMLGDTAIAVHPEDERYKHLIGQTVDHPFVDRKIPIVGDAILVDPAFGTGAVKVTPAHDFNDFAVGQRHGLPMINILHVDGTLNGQGGRFSGLDRFEARKQVKEALEELGLARGTKPHLLSLGRSQRSGAVAEPMLSTQWFMRMKPLARPATAAVENGYTRFVPEQWENTYYAWMRNIQDWCISRQLWWGHRIPAWYCADCGEATVSRVDVSVCAHCGSANIRQDEDVLDTWFSSALWPFSVFGWPEKTADLQRYYPTSVLVTAHDIIFFWVARMMFAGLHLTGSVPFSDVYIHALIRDKNGEKMSKTKGNVVDPLEVIEKWGADAFRFTMLSLAAQGRDILWDEKRVEASHRFETKLWQALRFCFIAAAPREVEGGPADAGYDPNGPMEFGTYDRWIQVRTGAAVERVRAALDAYKFNEAASEIHAFVWGEFCDWYLELCKGTLYDANASYASKNALRHTLFTTVGVIARLLHPLMPFFSEELWSRIPLEGRARFVATAAYPKAGEFPSDPAVLRDVAMLQDAITEVRRIRSDMELSPRIELRLQIADASVRARLAPHHRALRDLARVTVEELIERPKGFATAVIEGVEGVLPLAGIVDFGEEVKRLDKALAKVEKDATDLEKRLANQDFVERARPEIVDEMRAKLDAAVARRTTLRAARQHLAEAL